MNFKSEIKEIKMDSGEDAVGRWIQVYEKDLLSLFKREVGEIFKIGSDENHSYLGMRVSGRVAQLRRLNRLTIEKIVTKELCQIIANMEEESCKK